MKEEEEFEDDPYLKPLNLPIQSVDAPKDMTAIEKIEKSLFINLNPSMTKAKFRCLYHYQNPIHKSNPLNKNSKNPEIYALSVGGEERDLIASAYSNGEIHIYNKDKNVKVVQNSLDTLIGLKFNPNNNKIIVSISTLGQVTFTHVPTAKKLNDFLIEGFVLRCMDYSPIEDKIAIGFAEGQINIYDTNTQLLEKAIKKGLSFEKGHINQVSSVCFDKKYYYKLISGGRDRRVMIWDLRSLECSAMVEGPSILGDTLDIKGNYILAGCYEPKQGIMIFDERNFKEPIKTFTTDSHIYSCKFTKHDGKYTFAAGGYKRNAIKIYDINKNGYLAGIDGNDSACYALDFSPNGSILCYGCADGGIRIVDL